jgi:hypothetical protein
MKPNPAGFRENFVLDVSFYTAEPMIGLKIRAIDASKNVGAWSFVLSVKLKANVTLAPKLRHFVSDSKDYASSFRFLQEKTFEKVLYIFFGNFLNNNCELLPIKSLFVLISSYSGHNTYRTNHFFDRSHCQKCKKKAVIEASPSLIHSFESLFQSCKYKLNLF